MWVVFKDGDGGFDGVEGEPPTERMA